MTKIKFCGLRRPEDIAAANRIRPDYVGFVFAKGSSRQVTGEQAEALKAMLDPGIPAVGVFVDQRPEEIAALLARGTIDMAQLHGAEDEGYIARLRELTDKPVIKAFRVRNAEDVQAARKSSADLVLLDSGAGTGETFDWSLLRDVGRDYLLAGGLHPGNAAEALRQLHPYGLDVSSGIETDRVKDQEKMAAFAAAVRSEEGNEEKTV
ncbi:MAG: phosphoribosylanthranilate isomerase [Lachnospiraceae bacterium]|nr:phosphoribosylanthranilate isomerase [Lachnospiraceae bacterium]